MYKKYIFFTVFFLLSNFLKPMDDSSKFIEFVEKVPTLKQLCCKQIPAGLCHCLGKNQEEVDWSSEEMKNQAAHMLSNVPVDLHDDLINQLQVPTRCIKLSKKYFTIEAISTDNSLVMASKDDYKTLIKKIRPPNDAFEHKLKGAFGAGPISPDGKTVAVSNIGYKFGGWIFEIEKRTLTRKANKPFGGRSIFLNNSTIFNNSTLFNTRFDEHELIDIKKKEVIATIKNNFEQSNHLVFFPSRDLLCCSSSKRTVRGILVINMKSKKETKRLKEPSINFISCLAGNDLTGLLASGSEDGTALVWNIDNQEGTECEVVFSSEKDDEKITAVCFDSSGKTLLYGTDKGKIYFGDIASKERLMAIDLEDGLIKKLSWSKDNDTVLAYQKDLGLLEWDAKGLQLAMLMKKLQLEQNQEAKKT